MRPLEKCPSLHVFYLHFCAWCVEMEPFYGSQWTRGREHHPSIHAYFINLINSLELSVNLWGLIMVLFWRIPWENPQAKGDHVNSKKKGPSQVVILGNSPTTPHRNTSYSKVVANPSTVEAQPFAPGIWRERAEPLWATVSEPPCCFSNLTHLTEINERFTPCWRTWGLSKNPLQPSSGVFEASKMCRTMTFEDWNGTPLIKRDRMYREWTFFF